MATTVLDTFITRFGYKTDTKGLTTAKKGLADFKSSALKVGAAIGAIIGGGLFLNRIADAADETLKFADSIGVAVEMVDALGFAVQRQGGNVSGLRGSLEKINKTIGEVQRGTGAAKLAFDDYGLTVVKANGDIKTADELFLELNETFSTLSSAQQFDLARKMGIDTGTIKLLQTAPEAVRDLIAEAHSLGVLTRKDAESAAEFNDGLTNIAQALNAVKFAVGGVLFKPLAAFFKLIARGTSFIRENSRFIKILTVVLALLISPFIALKIAAAAAWLATFAPIIGIVAGIALISGVIALLIDDFISFFQGQDSLLGDAIGKWPILGDAIMFIRDILLWLFESTIAGFKTWFGWLSDIGQAFINLGTIIWDSIQAPIDAGIQKLKDFLNIGKRIKEGFKSFFGLGGDDNDVSLTKNINTGLIPAQANQIGSLQAAPSIIDKSSKSVTVENLAVDARGGDSEEIAQNVGSALKHQLQNTVQDFDSSIKK